MSLKKLNWNDAVGDNGVIDSDGNYVTDAASVAHAPLNDYVIKKVKGGYIVFYGGRHPDSTFKTIEAAKDWAENTHYRDKMQKWVEPDSVTDIVNWFKAAKPEPTDLDKCVQMGCHFEEFAEGIEAINSDADDIYEAAKDLKTVGAIETPDNIAMFVQCINKLELLDSLCDQIVTAIGVGYMMGFDMQGALAEVIRSNNSKMVNGKFEFDENGKIMKPKSFSEPQLESFLGVDHGKN